MALKQLTAGLAALTVLATLWAMLPNTAAGAPPKSFAVSNGYFYSEANGDERSPWGFTVSDNGGDLFYSEFKRYGGTAVLGYPISRRFFLDGFPSQAFQKGVLQWRKAENRAVFVNVFDRLSEVGRDDWLRTVRATPNMTIPKEKPDVPLADIQKARQAILNDNEAIKKAYFAVPDPMLQFGLPTSKVEDLGVAMVVRFQRAVIQQWKSDFPWAKKGEVTLANGGDIFKEAGLIDAAPAAPHAAPGYETDGPTPVVKAPLPGFTNATGANVTPKAGAVVPVAAVGTPTPTPIKKQIDPVTRIQPGRLEEVKNSAWMIVKLHQLDACENGWQGTGFLEALDQNGKGIDNVIIRSQSGEITIDNRTGTKSLGKVEQYFYKGNWTSFVYKDETGKETTSDRAVNMDTMIFADNTPEEQATLYCKGVMTKATGHYSYAVTWRKR